MVTYSGKVKTSQNQNQKQNKWHTQKNEIYKGSITNRELLQVSAMDWTVSPRNSYTEALIPNVTVMLALFYKWGLQRGNVPKAMWLANRKPGL